MTDRDRLLALLHRYGWNATSFQVLEPEFRYWFDGDDAAVAYVETKNAWVVAGAPVAAEERLGSVSARFAAHAARHRKRVAFFAVERRFLRAIAMPSIVIGAQPWWDPQAWSERHRGHRSFREQLRRARAKGVTVERVDADAVEPARAEFEALIDRWRASRRMPPMAFLVELNPFGFAAERRFYAARAGGRLEGLLVAVPIYQRDGWFIENVLRDPAAPNGTAEALVNAALVDAAADGCRFMTLGLAPLAGDERWLRLLRAAMQGFYNFEGLYAFKAKLRPDAWDPIYLAWPAGTLPVIALYDALDAFAGGALVRFAVRSTFRAPGSALFGLAALLVPWTIVLALAPTKRWFPSRGVQLAWTSFDGAMAAALFALANRWRTPLAIAACTAAAADAVATTAQAVRYNLPRSRRAGDLLVIAVSIAAPLLAFAILAGGIRSRNQKPETRNQKPETRKASAPLARSTSIF